MITVDGNDRHHSERVMLVVIHDFSSVFLSELTYITEKLAPLVGQQMSAAIVPCWHGEERCLGNAAYGDLLSQYAEHLLHGWTHQSQGRWRPISLMTGASDEFWGLNEATIVERIDSAQTAFRKLTGRDAAGFLPPAWQLPIRASRLSRLKFVMRFGCLESCSARGQKRRLATSSWDWGRLGWLGYGGEWMGDLLRWSRRTTVPCIAVHPIDVRRGHFARALRLVESLLRRGYRPTTATELMRVQDDRS